MVLAKKLQSMVKSDHRHSIKIRFYIKTIFSIDDVSISQHIFVNLGRVHTNQVFLCPLETTFHSHLELTLGCSDPLSLWRHMRQKYTQ